jgi:DNA-directed RNA polymerase subunit M/transcription elongation factor TFIIS
MAATFASVVARPYAERIVAELCQMYGSTLGAGFVARCETLLYHLNLSPTLAASNAPEALCHMSVRDMAPEAARAERARTSEAVRSDAAADAAGISRGGVTNHKCPLCSASNMTAMPFQSRRADEATSWRIACRTPGCPYQRIVANL